MKLSEKHRKDLRASGLTDATIDAEPWYTETNATAIARMLGFKSWKGGPCLVFPMTDPWDRSVVHSHRVRPDNPQAKPAKKGKKAEKPAKYLTPTKESGVARLGGELWFPAAVTPDRLADPNEPLVWVEGEKKASSLAQEGHLTIGVSGIWMFHDTERSVDRYVLHRSLDNVPLEGRQVTVCFDNSALDPNPDTKRSHEGARDRAVSMLEERGARVLFCTPPRVDEKSPKGIDDVLAAQGAVAVHAIICGAVPVTGNPASLVVKSAVPKYATALTDLGNAERFARAHGSTLRYCPQMQAWLVWDGKRWQRDDLDAVRAHAHTVARSIYDEAKGDIDVYDHAKASECAPRLSAMVKLAGELREMVADARELDVDPWMLNVANGIVDLRTGALMPHDPAAMITKLAPVAYVPGARSEKWEAFIRQTFGGNDELVAFVRRAIGYSVTGSMREEVFFLALGPPRSGKGTLFDSVFAAIGDYGKSADSSSFLARKDDDGSKARSDLVRLLGARFVGSSEFTRGARLDERRIKSITGGDALAVRELYEKAFERRPTFKVWFALNDPPKLSGDDALWARIKRVPFECGRRGAEVDKLLKSQLTSEPEHQQAVLAWAVAGAVEWYRDGLREPERITTANDDLRLGIDPAHAFAQTLVFTSKLECTTYAQLQAAATAWANGKGVEPPTMHDIRARLTAMGCKPVRIRDGHRVSRGMRGVSTKPVRVVDDGYRDDWGGEDRGAA